MLLHFIARCGCGERVHDDAVMVHLKRAAGLAAVWHGLFSGDHAFLGYHAALPLSRYPRFCAARATLLRRLRFQCTIQVRRVRGRLLLWLSMSTAELADAQPAL